MIDEVDLARYARRAHLPAHMIDNVRFADRDIALLDDRGDDLFPERPVGNTEGGCRPDASKRFDCGIDFHG